MEVRMQEKDGVVVKNVNEALQQVQQQLQEQQGQWLQELRGNPSAFANLEARIHQTFQGLADQVVAGVLAQVTSPADFAQGVKKK